MIRVTIQFGDKDDERKDCVVSRGFDAFSEVKEWMDVVESIDPNKPAKKKKKEKGTVCKGFSQSLKEEKGEDK